MSSDERIASLESSNQALQQRVAELERALAERERQVASLTDERNLLLTLVDQIPDFLYAKDRDLRFVFGNRSVAASFGLSEPRDIIGKSDADMFPPDMVAAYNAVEQSVIDSGQPLLDLEQMNLDEHGKTRWLLSSKLPWRDQRGAIIGVIGVGRDISARREAELALTRHREELEQEVTARTVELKAREAQFRALFDLAPVGISISRQGRTIQVNPTYLSQFGYDDAPTLVGTSILSRIAPRARADMAERIRQRESDRPGETSYTTIGLRSDGSEFPILVEVAQIPLADGQRGSVSFISDLSDLQRAEAERLALQEQVIVAQQEALRELSTPLIPLADELVAMPLIGAIDDRRAQQIMETLLEGIVAQQASYAILDITGVKVVDTHVANALLRVAQAAKLLGAQVILTGIGAEVAQTLVQLGANLGDIVTRSNLQSGIAYAMGR